MKKILIFTLLLFACREATINPRCEFVTISDALPIQFWLVNCQTYNEVEVCGVHKKCYCQPWECDVPIKLQLFDDGFDNSYVLQVINENSDILATQLFEQSPILYDISLPSFNGGTWSNKTGNDDDWNIGATPSVATGGGGNSCIMQSDLFGFIPGLITISPNITLNMVSGNGTIIIRLYDSSDSLISDETIVGSGTITTTFQMQPESTPKRIEIEFFNDSGSFGEATITSLTITQYRAFRDVHDISFTPSDYDICDEKIAFKIFGDNTELIDSEIGSTPFSNDDSSGTVPWIIDEDDFRVIFGSEPFPGTLSNYATANALGEQGLVIVNYTFSVGASAGAVVFSVTMTFFLSGSPVYSVDIGDFIGPDGSGANYTGTISVDVPNNFDEIKLQVEMVGESFKDFEVTTMQVYNSVESAKSDCIDVRQNHECLNHVEYSNTRNFAGLIYENLISPDISFTALIPSIFFHEQPDETDETIELVNSVLSLNSELKEKRLFETDYLPYYMHRKIQLILKHQSVTISGKEWVKRDAYEIVEGDRRWPVKKAKVFLMDKNYVHRNIL